MQALLQHELLRSMPPRQLVLLLGSLVLLFVVLLLMYLIVPQLKDYRALNKSRTVLKAAVFNKQALDQQLSMESSLVENLGKKLHGDMGNLPERQIESYVIGRLQSISWRHQMELKGVVPGAGQLIKTFQELLFNVDIAGDYKDLYSWLKDLSKELGFVVIKKFEIRPANLNTENPRLAVQLTIATYRSTE